MSGPSEQHKSDSSNMDSSVESSLLNSTHISEDMNDELFNKIKSNLESMLDHYRNKAQETKKVLKSLGCSAEDLPESMREQLKSTFKDSSAFIFNDVGSKEMVMINPEHVMTSLSADKKTADVLRQKKVAEAAVNKLKDLDNKLDRALKEEKELQKEDLIYLKKAQILKCSVELDKAREELHSLEQLPKVEMPSYTMEELKSLETEQSKLQGEIALVKSKLKKYNSLPLSENAAAERLKDLKKELDTINDLIKMKVKN